MPPPPRSEPGVKVVRRRLADGTIKEYRYARPAPPDAPPPAGSLSALLAAYKGSSKWRGLKPSTQAQYLIYLSHWEQDHLATLPITGITRQMVLQMRDSVADRSGDGAATAFGRITGALFGWAVDRGWIDHSPVTRLKPLPQGELPAWTEAQIDRALEKLPEALRRVVTLGLHTGQRRGDLIAMTWGQVADGVITVRQQKTGALVVIPVHPSLRKSLDAWGWRGDGDPVLLSPRGKRWTAPHLSREMGVALQAAGLPKGLNIHGLRKAAARRLAEAGCTTHEIAAVTGHKTLAMVQHYSASADKARLARAAMKRLENVPENAGKGRVISLLYRRKA